MGPIIYPLRKGWFGLKKNVCKCHPKPADSYGTAAGSRVTTKHNEALPAAFRQRILGKIFHFAEKTEPPETFASD